MDRAIAHAMLAGGTLGLIGGLTGDAFWGALFGAVAAAIITASGPIIQEIRRRQGE